MCPCLNAATVQIPSTCQIYLISTWLVSVINVNWSQTILTHNKNDSDVEEYSYANINYDDGDDCI